MIPPRLHPILAPRGGVVCLIVFVLLVLPYSPTLAWGASENSPELQAISLPELEAQFADADEVQMARADLEAAGAMLAAQQKEQGLKLFAGANAGATTDTSLAGSEKHYTTYDIRAGLRYPILGRAAMEEDGVAEAAIAVKEKEHHLRLVRLQGLSLLRRSYLEYWANQEKLHLTQHFLAGEAQQAALLTKRLHAGFLLKADYLEFLSAFDLARRNQAHFRAHSQSRLHILQRLGHASGAFLALSPTLPSPCLDKDRLQTIVLAEHPSINALQNRLAGFEEQAELAAKNQLKANVDLYSATGNDDSRNAPEYTIGAGIAVELPASSLLNHKRPAEVAAQAKVQRCRHELALEKDSLRQQAEEALALFEASSHDLALAVQRLNASGEAVRERLLRIAMEGDSLEKLQQSRYGYYQVALDAIDARVRRWQHQVTLLEYAPARQERADHPGLVAQTPVPDASLLIGQPPSDQTSRTHALTDTGKPLTRGLYVWQSQRFIKRTQAKPGLVDRLKSAGFRRIFLSLDRGQINSLQKQTPRKHFANWLNQMHAQGLEISLLLGESRWILPRHRPALLGILASLHTLPFSGLHLDIEPDQLTPSDKQNVDLANEWLATVAAAIKKSPWPVGVSLHPRAFNPQDGWPQLGASLHKIGVAEVTLMIYNTNIDKVTAVASPILRATPDLAFSVAQSVEPILTSAESHAGKTQPTFSQAMTNLVSNLQQANFTGILVQDWQSWEAMKP